MNHEARIQSRLSAIGSELDEWLYEQGVELVLEPGPDGTATIYLYDNDTNVRVVHETETYAP